MRRPIVWAVVAAAVVLVAVSAFFYRQHARMQRLIRARVHLSIVDQFHGKQIEFKGNPAKPDRQEFLREYSRVYAFDVPANEVKTALLKEVKERGWLVTNEEPGALAFWKRKGLFAGIFNSDPKFYWYAPTGTTCTVLVYWPGNSD